MSEEQKPAWGNEMRPLVHDGDELEVERCELEELRFGDVLYFQQGGTARHLGWWQGAVVARADAVPYIQFLNPEDVVGRVVAATRAGVGRRFDRRGWHTALAGLGLATGVVYTILFHLINFVHLPLWLLSAALERSSRGPSPSSRRAADESSSRDSVHGYSMFPVARTGDLLVEDPEPEPRRIGDLVLVRFPTKYIGHRLILAFPRQDLFVEKGDNDLRMTWFGKDRLGTRFIAVERLDGQLRDACLQGTRARVLAGVSLLIGVAWLPVGFVLSRLFNLPVWIVAAILQRLQTRA